MGDMLQLSFFKGGLTVSCLACSYSMVLFAGIAAEALVYGEAEGGENDENLFKSIISLLRPPWSASQVWMLFRLQLKNST